MKLRITRYAQAPLDALRPHPLNARLHPPHQGQALAALLDAVGWVKHLVVNETTGHVLNGHLRLEQARAAGEPTVPVAYVDLDESEERLVLSLFDAVGDLAVTDVEQLDTLLSAAQADAPSLKTLLAQMGRDAGLGLDFDVAADDEPGADETPRSDVTGRIGEIRLVIERATFERWQQSLFATVGFDETQIIAEIRRRLGL